jgi:tRNA nucleotidyltransferase (CCA-adding enzyme)
VGDEITKMIKGKSFIMRSRVATIDLYVSDSGRDPLRAAQLIRELELYHTVFSVLPTGIQASISLTSLEAASREALAAVSILHGLFSGNSTFPSPPPALLSLIQDPATKARLYLAGLLLPYIGVTYRDGKAKTQSAAAAVIRESLKLGTQNHYLDGIPALFAGIPIIKDGMEKDQQAHMSRAQLGLLLRNKFVHSPLIGTHWSTSVLFSLVTELVPCYDIKDEKFHRESSILRPIAPFIDTLLSNRGYQRGHGTIPCFYGEDN